MAKDKAESPAPAIKKVIVKEKTSEWLKYEFPEDELREMSVEMAKDTIRVKGLEERKKSVTSDFKAQIDEASLSANNLARKIQDGSEYRDVPCVKELNFKTGEVRISRVDTGELVKERKMNDGEKQMTITGTFDEQKEEDK